MIMTINISGLILKTKSSGAVPLFSNFVSGADGYLTVVGLKSSKFVPTFSLF
jgi:hypothetical protein